jgi:hypothetical protein
MSLNNKCVFYPDGAVRKLREYAETSKHGMEKRWNILKEAQRFISKDDAELWSLVIDPYILRSHYVHTNSLCPVCRKKRLLYDWEIDPISFPWKVRCPDCKNYFPKNDFYSFYKSGIDETGVFRYEKADKTLLFNTEHPDPNDPLHMFAVDDGNGYCNGDTVQRFIGYYLIHGHHKDLVRGIYSLSYAYLLTGKPEYARKCAVLLDRYADYWPNYDAHTQVYVHEQLYSTEGYFGYWFHSYYDISVFTHAYDIIRGAMLEDQELLAFVKAQKEKHGLPYTVNSPQDILQHIENRILKDALANYKKCRSNFPMTHALYAIIHTVLGNDETVDSLLEEIIVQCTERDGATKENGLTGYTNHELELYRNGKLVTEGETITADVVGNICESGDILAKERTIFMPQEKDIIGVMDAGAYGYSMSSNYNNRLRPAEVLIRSDGSVQLIRRRDTLEDLIRNF